jgi:hypothetical protein
MVRVAVTVREVGMHLLHLFAPVLMTMLTAGYPIIVLMLVVFVLDVSVVCNSL